SSWSRVAFRLFGVLPGTSRARCRQPQCDWTLCNPHSFFSSCSHHQRPARSDSPGRMALVHGAGQAIGIDRQGNADGYAALFIRPHDVTILHDPDAAALRETIRRVHGLGAARRVEIALAKNGDEHLIEVDAP